MKSCTLSILIALATLMIARTLPGQSVADAISDSKRLTAIELLKRNCFDCHGGTKTSAGVRVLDRDALVLKKKKVVPGRPEDSRLMHLLTAQGRSAGRDPEQSTNPLGSRP